MGYKIGTDRKQLSLLPASLDEYVPEDHICRVITAFTGQLDMAGLGFKYAECKSTGCRPYDPQMMLDLYLYGYLHRVRSSRRLRDETRRNVEVMWLLEGLCPDDKTICNFRKDNTKALREIFRVFTQMCRKFGLYGEELEATDSAKFRANNSLKNHRNKTVVQNELTRIEKKINEYLAALEQADQEDEGRKEPSSSEIRAALEILKERKEAYEELQTQVEAEGEISTVDPESRLMRSGGDDRLLNVGYSVQTVVDGKYHMIVDFEVTNNSGDSGELHRMSERAKEILEVEEITNLADKGYYSGEDIAACERDGVTCLVARPDYKGPRKEKEFAHGSFRYDKENDVYVCPCHQELRYMRNHTGSNGHERKIYANYEACPRCGRKAECTSYKYREVMRLVEQDTLDIVDERTRNNKELYRRRSEIVEHVFGTVKAVWGYRQYLCRGKEKVTAETALAYLAYNMRRAFNIFAESRISLAGALA
jgi:transposase